MPCLTVPYDARPYQAARSTAAPFEATPCGAKTMPGKAETGEVLKIIK